MLTVRLMCRGYESRRGCMVLSCSVPDGVLFTITRVSDIMEGHDDPGIRFMPEPSLNKKLTVMNQQIPGLARRR